MIAARPICASRPGKWPATATDGWLLPCQAPRTRALSAVDLSEVGPRSESIYLISWTSACSAAVAAPVDHGCQRQGLMIRNITVDCLVAGLHDNCIGEPMRTCGGTTVRVFLASLFEAVFRWSLIRMALEQASPFGYRIWRSDAAKPVDPTEKGAWWLEGEQLGGPVG